VWRSWLQASSQLEAHLGRRMQADGDISMSDFAVLVPLSEAPEARLRAFALGRELQWEKSRLSHHLSRMERRGLVTREDCGTTAGVPFVVLTSEGRSALETAAARTRGVRARCSTAHPSRSTGWRDLRRGPRRARPGRGLRLPGRATGLREATACRRRADSDRSRCRR
jgi:DNA-binding MarR family transcriptional regulator